ncbi:MAG TPA: response regulator transcription factor [Gammaproteobacteria bacterium]|nr:transcriptional regulatory protein CusR [bacterium BMS3Abin11]GMT41566.1 MAG: DNA-binding response regulator [bacterium]HDH09219.1 response regulator transcription factor [Gammaproteobacteria bacterium]HDH16125.1 response regulator transcription factor [Gammaproteobacteria bacterium]HDZ78865.1 response regulator transcription factor [Gammaproteobacteria bacterium]
MHTLVIEDDIETANYIAKGLKEHGHVVDQASDGKDGLFMSLENDYDIIILDRMLPALDGLSILKTLRISERQTPVIILSALGEVDDRVEGLKAGGDDYLVKPFAFSELLARIEALLRRGEIKPDTSLMKVADLELDRLTHTVKRAGKTIDLQPREYMILEFFMQHAGQVVTRTMLLESVWDYHFDPQTNIIDVHISRLRNKIDKEFDSPLLQTVRGAGYCLRESSA